MVNNSRIFKESGSELYLSLGYTSSKDMGISNFPQIVVELNSEIGIHSMRSIIYSIQMIMLDGMDHIMNENSTATRVQKSRAYYLKCVGFK